MYGNPNGSVFYLLTDVTGYYENIQGFKRSETFLKGESIKTYFSCIKL